MRTKVTIYETLQGDYAYKITKVNAKGEEYPTGLNSGGYVSIGEAAKAVEIEMAKGWA